MVLPLVKMSQDARYSIRGAFEVVIDNIAKVSIRGTCISLGNFLNCADIFS